MFMPGNDKGGDTLFYLTCLYAFLAVCEWGQGRYPSHQEDLFLIISNPDVGERERISF